MISNRIRVLAIALVCCLGFLGFSMAQQQSSTSIGSSGTISLKRNYICGNYNSTHYYAQNNATGNYELISTDATQTISYALSKLTSGRTWQETVLLRGNFLIGTTVALSQSNVLLDCGQATLTSTASTPLKVQSRDVTILGGHWIGQVADTRIQFSGDGITNCIVDGIDTTNVGVELGWGVSHATIRNCGFHDKPITEPGYFLIINGYQGYMTVQNCHFHNGRGGIFVNSGAPHNQFIDCEFDNLQSHGIYMDGSGGVGGYNIVTGCKFHDQVYQAGLHIKCNYNKIYNNAFYNYPAGGDAGLSIYSEYSPSYANDNEIYNNTFTDMTYAFWIGHNPANYPTLRNKIHDNTFTRVTNCIMLNPWNGAINTVEDTWIYYNTFTSCTDIFPASGDSPSLVIDTVIAYNDFSPAITNLWVESCGNTMVYGNIGMADFNVPSPLPIPPP